MFTIRRAAERYSEIGTHHCPRCGAFAGSDCVDGHSGKKRKVPHRDRIEAAAIEPRKPRRPAEPLARAPEPRPARKPASGRRRPAEPQNPVHGLMASLASAFSGR